MRDFETRLYADYPFPWVEEAVIYLVFSDLRFKPASWQPAKCNPDIKAILEFFAVFYIHFVPVLQLIME